MKGVRKRHPSGRPEVLASLLCKLRVYAVQAQCQRASPIS